MTERKDNSKWVIGILLLLIFTCSVLLYLHLTEGAKGGENPEIGILTFKHKTIERKYDSDVIWNRIESGLVIRNKDTIRSGDFSDAVLTLKDNTQININENSMIYLDVSDDNVNLNFAYGSLSLAQGKNGNSNLAKSIKINSGKTVLELKNTNIAIEKKGKEEINFHVKEGNVKLTNGNKEKLVNANESVNMKDKEVIVSQVNLNLIEPADNSVLTGKSKSIPVAFSWDSKNVSKLKLEISYDPKFSRMFRTFQVSGKSFQTNLESGVYFWRVASEKGKKAANADYSPYRKIIIVSTSPPTINYPKNNQVFSYTSVLPIIDFGWNRIEIAKSYKLEISKSSNFSDVTRFVSTSNNSASVDKLEVGKYYARLEYEPLTKDLPKERSDVISFSIDAKQQVDAPTLVSNTDGQKFYKMNSDKSGVVLQVKDSPEIVKYTFQVSDSKGFVRIIHEETTNTNQIKLKDKFEKGDYYWRVSGITRDGKKTAYSDAGKFTIQELQEMELISPNDRHIAELDSTISFQWKKLPCKCKFVLDVSDTPDFAQKKYSTTTNSYVQSHKFTSEGKYFWRVTALAEDDSVVVKSQTKSFVIETIKDVEPIYPASNNRVDMSFSDSITFKWEKNPKVEQFEFEFFHEIQGQRELVARNKTKANSYTFRDLTKLDEGKFYWTLRGYFSRDGKLQPGKKLEVPFRIFLSDKKEPPKIETPKKMYVE